MLVFVLWDAVQGFASALLNAKRSDCVVSFLTLLASFGSVGRACICHLLDVPVALLPRHDSEQLLLRFVNDAVHFRPRLPAMLVCVRAGVRVQH